MALGRALFVFLGCVCFVTVWAGIPCDFETDLCGYQDGSGMNFQWVRQNGSMANPATGPGIDHTTGTSLGYYLFSKAAGQSKGDRAQMKSPYELSAVPRCVQFWYYMVGSQMGSLRVYTKDNTSDTLGKPGFEMSGPQNGQWLRGLITMPQVVNKSVQIIFESEVGTGPLSDIAIDDVEITANVKCPLDGFFCDFETTNGMCDIVQDRTDDFDFVRRRGSTASYYTGPSGDHTTGTGYYMYIESSGLTRGKKARLITPTYRGVQANDKETFCVVFWYHMLGATVGELNLYLKNASSPDLGDPIWWRGGNRGDLWRAGEAELNTPEDFNLYFEAIRGQSFTSDIAIDDINITSYACPGHHIIKNVSSVSCDFEEAELCYYTQDKTDNFDWEWRNRGTRDGFTGPDEDHTRGDELGFFMFISGTYYQSPLDKARLISPVIEDNAKISCLEFWYHMFGQDVEALAVYIKPDGGSLPTTPAWNTTGNQWNFWHYAQFEIPKNSGKTRIVFEASPGITNRDDVAIDDVKLTEGQNCEPYVTTPPPTTLPPPVVDKFNCTFEDDFCNFTQSWREDLMDWSRYQGYGPGPYRFYGPNVDHTKGTSLGYYASMDPYQYYGARLDDNAILVSPVLGASQQSRCMIFFAYMYGYYVDYLNIYIRPYGQTMPFDPAFSIYGNKGRGWLRQEMDIPASDDDFQILFEGLVGRSRYYSEIAVDDIFVIDGNCVQPTSTPKPEKPWKADCDFEQSGSMCGYTHYPYGDFDWGRQSGATGSVGTGPRADHTLHSELGHYMYIEASLPQRPGYDATLVSPPINIGGEDVCMRFYYHAFGDDTGLLAVKVKIVDSNIIMVLFSLTGDQGDEWLPANINLREEDFGLSDIQIMFEGRKGNGFLGDVAIDDIKFFRRPCEGFPTASTCTFELGLSYCGFYIQKDASGLAAWRWFDYLAAEPSPIQADGKTSFMYVKSDGSQTRTKKTILYSETHDMIQIDHCFTADIVIWGDTLQRLKIEAIEQSTTDMTKAGKKHPIASLSGDMGKEWFRGNWTLEAKMTDNPFKLVFTATLGNSGVIAVDNVIFSTQLDGCAEYIPPPTKPSNPLSTTKQVVTDRKTTTAKTSPAPTTPTAPAPTTIGKPVSGGSSTIIIGIVVPLVILVVAVVVTIVVCKFRRGLPDSLNITYKNQKLDEIPISSVPTDPAVVFSNPDMKGLSNA